ncbi:MAG: T9SS type A sorting domain-containing protein [Bacteroidales bacterium]|jgi:hypothetical protein|nr:T9SS type A sorting domain-containing protein [Bacteroidales bacterium]
MKKTANTIKIVLLVLLFFGITHLSFSQVILEANGPGDTYELINSILAPGYNVVENPECVHPEFGRHIVEVWDTELNQYVFEFYIHVVPDNDRCINFDRQRMEIKTYDKSPENLIGISGETVTYKWKFRLPAGFKPSNYFTHIHQVKAVGGNDSDPIFTLTPRKGSVNKMELIHNDQTKVAIVNLSLFEGNWVEAEEKLKIDTLHGTYSITIKKVSDGTIILSYTNNDLMTIRSDNTFIRPKWGIYRSLNNPADLRDEAVRFAGFSITEGASTAVYDNGMDALDGLIIYPNPASGRATIEYNLHERSDIQIDIFSTLGGKVKTLPISEPPQTGLNRQIFDISDLKNGIYFVRISAGYIIQTVKFYVIR